MGAYQVAFQRVAIPVDRPSVVPGPEEGNQGAYPAVDIHYPLADRPVLALVDHRIASEVDLRSDLACEVACRIDLVVRPWVVLD